MPTTQQRNCAINIRAQEAQKQLIDKAANISNKTRSDFMLESACKEAENVLLDKRLFLTDDETYDDFLNILEAPIENNLGLIALMKSKSPWEK